jgi:4-amino-4-deoxy-L-arabinose transferase-like glycosyltransferase
LRTGRTREVLLAGVGLGLACASKYTAGIALAPLVAAIAARYVQAGAGSGRRTLAQLALAAAAALGAFLLANPYAVLDYQSFHHGLIHQSTQASESQGKLGAPRHGGLVYYLWSLTWGLGWAPALAALGGAVSVWRREPALGWLLVPAPLLFLLFMGLQGRYFGRWLMPILPIMCLLAAVFALQVATAAGGALGRLRALRARPQLAGALVALAIAAVLLTQGLIYGIHSGLVLSRADTRNLTRAWMVAHVPAGAAIVAEPVSPDEWARETRPGTARASNPYAWKKYASLVSRITPTGALRSPARHALTIEDYVRTLSPALISYYESHGYCWVVSGSTQSGRAFADPRAVPHAIAYYRALASQGEVAYRITPYAHAARPVGFGFDWSFDYYPLGYYRPGPEMTVYRLHAGGCRA